MVRLFHGFYRHLRTSIRFSYMYVGFAGGASVRAERRGANVQGNRLGLHAQDAYFVEELAGLLNLTLEVTGNPLDCLSCCAGKS